MSRRSREAAVIGIIGFWSVHNMIGVLADRYS